MSLSRFSQLSGHYDKTFKPTRGSRGMQLGIIGEDMPTREHKHSLGTGLSYISEGAPATRMSIAQQLQEQVVSASLPGKSQHMRVCWMFGESIQNGRGMRRRAGIRVPNLPSSRISNPAIFISQTFKSLAIISDPSTSVLYLVSRSQWPLKSSSSPMDLKFHRPQLFPNHTPEMQ